jgi:hypothetical protein
LAGAGLAANSRQYTGSNNTQGRAKIQSNGRSSGKGNKAAGAAGLLAASGQTSDHTPAGNQSEGSQTNKSSHSANQMGASSRTGRQQTAGEAFSPEYAFVQRPFSLRSRPRVSDSALRAYIGSSSNKKPDDAIRAVRVNRSLGIGLLFAPDFSSVNSLAGDRPGSTFGLTLDYEVLNRLHLGTGLLYSRRNYTARGMDYHVPYDYYRQNGMKPADFVKGTMNMLEIPITLRYDFSVTGPTTFFASAGVSSYIFGQEHCNYYFDFFGNEACRDFHYTNTPNALFSSINLSIGVEAKLNNDFHVLIAPYMKFPSSDIGFGKVKMNSVGINFAIRYTPIIGRQRPNY